MNDTGPHSDATDRGNAYDVLDRAIIAARQLAAAASSEPSDFSRSSAADELAYLLMSQVAEETLDFAHSTFHLRDADRQVETAEAQNPEPPSNSGVEEDASAQASARTRRLGPWLHLMVPAVVTAQAVGVVALVTVWTPGLLSESLAQVLSHKGRMTAPARPAPLVVAQADIPVSNPSNSEVVLPTTLPTTATEPPSDPASSASTDSPVPENARSPLPADSSPDVTIVSPSDPATPPPGTGSSTVPDEVAGVVDEKKPEGYDIPLSPPRSIEIRSVSEQASSVAPAGVLFEDGAAALPERSEQETSSVETRAVEQSDPLSQTAIPLTSPFNHEETQQPASLPDQRPSHDDALGTITAPGAALPPSQDASSGSPLALDGNGPASDLVNRLAEMVGILTTERQTVLERERERADAFARELARLREELGTLLSRPALPWNMTPFIPLPPTEPAQMPDLEGSLEEPTGSAPPAPMPNLTPAALPDKNSASPPSPSIGSASVQPLIDRAEALLRVRDISGARLLLERAAERGSARGTYLLAQTYDPSMLARWQVRGIMGDPERAKKLYGQSGMPASSVAAEIASTR
ncbi:hypothetical protein MicloDRAFT_00007580 [Microvirga lotononidis]|uniref:Uncharacterized protein n=1 Tax=Microvirga lotononidis TaxID=864069 RepID=I4Z2R6_9HYPH|nr:hypothetical protein MicloDRAFT_00007580 [Microvirga lotononidis]